MTTLLAQTLFEEVVGTFGTMLQLGGAAWVLAWVWRTRKFARGEK